MVKIGEEFLKKYGDDPRTGVRTRLRLYETIEKARKLLSGDTEATISIDYLMNEEDLVRKLKREEFEQLIDPQVRQLATLLRETLTLSGTSSFISSFKSFAVKSCLWAAIDSEKE